MTRTCDSSVATPQRITQLEAIAQTEVGREITAIKQAARGGMERAARSIAAATEPRVAVLTGCYIPQARPPAAETDGPPGAALLCAALSAMGIPARLLTDPLCAPVVRGAAVGAGGEIPIDVNPGDDPSLERLAADYERAGITHIVSVERLGPGIDGRVHNMRGTDVSAYTPPLHRVLVRSGWTTIGIGDGGNEVGMGSLPMEAFTHLTGDQRRSRCDVACDALIVTGVSNWGAVALGLGVALLSGPRAVSAAVPLLTAERHDAVLAATVAAGGVDGVLGRQAPSVDGVDLELHRRVVTEMGTVAQTCEGSP